MSTTVDDLFIGIDCIEQMRRKIRTLMETIVPLVPSRDIAAYGELLHEEGITDRDPPLLIAAGQETFWIISFIRYNGGWSDPSVYTVELVVGTKKVFCYRDKKRWGYEEPQLMHVQTIHASLGFFYDGMVKAFPSLQRALVPFFRAASSRVL